MWSLVCWVPLYLCCDFGPPPKTFLDGEAPENLIKVRFNVIHRQRWLCLPNSHALWCVCDVLLRSASISSKTVATFLTFNFGCFSLTTLLLIFLGMREFQQRYHSARVIQQKGVVTVPALPAFPDPFVSTLVLVFSYSIQGSGCVLASPDGHRGCCYYCLPGQPTARRRRVRIEDSNMSSFVTLSSQKTVPE